MPWGRCTFQLRSLWSTRNTTLAGYGPGARLNLECDIIAKHVAKLLELSGEGAEQAKADAQTVLRIETGLANAYLSRVEMRDPKNRDNPMSVIELEQLAPGFDFADFEIPGREELLREFPQHAELIRGLTRGPG